MTTAGILLAAGQSRRFGKNNKLLADFHGKELASYAADAMTSASFDHKIAVVSDPSTAKIFFEYTLIQAPVDNISQSASLRAGVAYASNFGATQIVIALADMPFVTADTLNEIARISKNQGIAACTDGTRRTPPAGFRAEYFDALGASSGDTGAKSMIRSLPEECLLTVETRQLLDIDTASDFSSSF